MSKIDQLLVEALFSEYVGFENPKVIKGPQYGVDCSLIQITDKLGMVTASDPLSYIHTIGIKESAYISIHLAANDIATTGLSPQYGQFVLNLPSSMQEEELKKYWQYISEFSKKIGLSITGGHTGFDAYTSSSVVGGVTLSAVGEIKEVLFASDAQIDDVLLMTKSAGLIATSILAMSFPNYVKEHLGVETYDKLETNIWNISVLPEARLMHGFNCEDKVIHAMHDVTEGGILGSAYEFAKASKRGLRIFKDKIQVGIEVASAAQLFGLDPLEIIGAGSMLIACKPIAKNHVIEALQKSQISCTEIGYFRDEEYGITVSDLEDEVELPAPKQDAYWEVFFNCMRNGIS